MTPIAYVARDARGEARAVIPIDPKRQAGIAGELAKLRRMGLRVQREPMPPRLVRSS